MLYKEPNYDFCKKQKYIFEAMPYNKDINFNDIAALEGFINKNGYIPGQYIKLFLNYVVYYVRDMFVRVPDSPLNDSMSGKCLPCAAAIHNFLEKLGIKVEDFNVGDIFRTEGIHQLSIAHIPTIKNDKVITLPVLMDPSFRQFCLEEENRFDRFFEEPRGGVRMATPHPGYFLGLTEEGRSFANDLITYGYFFMSDDNVKRYFDAFKLYLTPKDMYTDDTLGKVSSTSFTGDYYKQRIESCIKQNTMRHYYQVETPLEHIEKQKKGFRYKFKHMLNDSDEFRSNLNLEIEPKKPRKN